MIVVENLAVRVGQFALEKISFTIPTGHYGFLMGKTGTGKALAAGATDAGAAETVVAGPFIGIGKDIVGLGCLLELFFGLLVAGILVGVILVRQAAVSALDVLGTGVFVDAQHLVKIGHGPYCLYSDSAMVKALCSRALYEVSKSATSSCSRVPRRVIKSC